MLVAKTIHPWKARQLVQSYSAEGIGHWVERHPGDDYPLWVVNGLPESSPGLVRPGPTEPDGDARQ